MPGFTILLDENKREFFALESCPLGGELEEYGIETELEFVFPFLDLLIGRTYIRKRIKSSSCLVVGDDELRIIQNLDTVDPSCELYPVEENPTEGRAEIIF